MSAPRMQQHDGRWFCDGVTRCPGGAVYAKGDGPTRDAAYQAFRRQTKGRIRAMEQEEATQRWAAKAEGMR